MFALLVSAILGLVYWSIEEGVVDYRCERKYLALLKWVCVLGLIFEMFMIHYDEMYKNMIYLIYKTVIFVLYAIGDVIIVFNQNVSICFFMMGHCLLLYVPTFEMMMLAMDGVLLVCVCSLLVTLLFSWIFRRMNPDIEGEMLMFYVSYIFVLSVMLVVPLVVSGYYGGLFFVLSDVLIGLKIRRLSKFTFPLYYISLICLLYMYTIGMN